MVRCATTVIVLGLLVTANVLGFSLFASAQTDQMKYSVVFNPQVILDKDFENATINFTFQITVFSSAATTFSGMTQLGALPLAQTVTLSWKTNRSGVSPMFTEINVTGPIQSTSFLRISSDSCIYLKDLKWPSSNWPSGWGESGWSVSFDGRTYVYSVLQTFEKPLESSVMLPSFTGDSSFLGCSVESRTKTLTIDLVLSVDSARKYTIDFAPLEQNNARMTLWRIPGTHVGDLRPGSRILIVRHDITNVKLGGSYGYWLPSLEYSKPWLTGFQVHLNLSEQETFRIGPTIAELLTNEPTILMNEDLTLLNMTRAIVPDIVARLQQAKQDLDDFESQSREGIGALNTFPLERALGSVYQARDEMETLVSSTSMVVAPVTFLVILILGATLSHLLFNGSKKATFVLLVVFSLVAFEVHPGLRLFVFSIRPELMLSYLSNIPLERWLTQLGHWISSGIPTVFVPLVWAILSLILVSSVALLIFKYPGTASVHSLVASNAVRLLKRRKLRGALTIVTVAAITMAIIPGVTLKMAIPTASDVRTVPQIEEPLICFSNSWSLFVTRSSMRETSVEKSDGFIPMSYDEVSFTASKLHLAEYTPVSIIPYASQTLSGSILCADLNFLRTHMWLELEKAPEASDQMNGIYLNEQLLSQNLSVPTSFTVAGAKLDVIGTFTTSKLLMLNGEKMEDYLKKAKILAGLPTWNSLTGPTSDMLPTLGGQVISQVTRYAPGTIYIEYGTDTSKKYSIPTPVIGIIDLSSIKDPSSPIRLFAIGTCTDSSALDQAKDYFGSLISANRIYLNRAIATIGMATTVEFVSSCSATFLDGSRSEIIQAGFPVPMAFGTWYSQLILLSIGSLIIFMVVLNSTYERRGEAIIMSSLGASPGFITYSFLIEGLMLGLMGGCIGYILGYAWAYWIGVSSPQVASELHGLTPLILIFLLSMAFTAIGSAFPAREAIFKVVPSKRMLSREVGHVKIEKDGARRVPIPLRLRRSQLEQFSSFISNMTRYYSYVSYGIAVHSHEKQAEGETMRITYRGPVGFSERTADYDLGIEYVPVGESYQIELVARSPNGEWTNDQKALLKQMLYDLRGELLRITLSRYWETS